MKHFEWDPDKNAKLLRERGICFEDIQSAIEEGRVWELIDHPNQDKYPGQKMYMVELNQYVYSVPFVEEEEKIFLKTIIPSRKMTKHYLVERKEV